MGMSVSRSIQLRDLAAHNLWVTCPEHGKRMIPVNDIRQRAPLSVSIGEVVDRLRCKECGAKPSRVELAGPSWVGGKPLVLI